MAAIVTWKKPPKKHMASPYTIPRTFTGRIVYICDVEPPPECPPCTGVSPREGKATGKQSNTCPGGGGGVTEPRVGFSRVLALNELLVVLLF